MQIDITITHKVAPEVFDFFRALIGGDATTAAVKPAKKDKLKAVEPDEPATGAEESKDKKITLEILRAKATEVIDGGSKPELMALLEKYEAPSVSKLPAAKYADFHKDLLKIAV